jgi:hypothetical protein
MNIGWITEPATIITQLPEIAQCPRLVQAAQGIRDSPPPNQEMSDNSQRIGSGVDMWPWLGELESRLLINLLGKGKSFYIGTHERKACNPGIADHHFATTWQTEKNKPHEWRKTESQLIALDTGFSHAWKLHIQHISLFFLFENLGSFDWIQSLAHERCLTNMSTSWGHLEIL